jgi:hypothetical protein
MPAVVVLSVLEMARINRQLAERPLLGLLLAGIVALLLSLPFGYYLWKHLAQFLSHTSTVTVFDPGVNGGDIVGTLSLNILRLLGVFPFLGNREWIRNLPGQPALDPLLGATILAGLVIAGQLLRRGTGSLQRARWVLRVVWLGSFLSPPF